MSDEFGSGLHGPRSAAASGGVRVQDLGAPDLRAQDLRTQQDLRTEDGLAAEEARPLDLVEVSGRIKWFDVAKGFGFIVPDNGMPTCCSTSPACAATATRPRTRAPASWSRRCSGRAACRRSGWSRSTKRPRSTLRAAAAAHARHRHADERAGAAVVKWFNRLRGFGFLTRGDGTPDIFVHMETCAATASPSCGQGEKVLVRYGDGSKGLMAAEVRLVAGALPASHWPEHRFSARRRSLSSSARCPRWPGAAPRCGWSRPDRGGAGGEAEALAIATSGDGATPGGGGAQRRRSLARADVPPLAGAGPRHAVRFRRVEPVSMWMQNTYMPLDMLFIRADGTVARVAETPSRSRPVGPLGRAGARGARAHRRHGRPARDPRRRPGRARDLQGALRSVRTNREHALTRIPFRISVPAMFRTGRGQRP